MADAIRCDEADYLVWKWRPAGAGGYPTHRENAIRFGSSLRVREGELAVFVYPQADGSQHDYLPGPQDVVLRTRNLPVLASLLGLAYDGDSPFQAEVYFLNLASNNQLRFGLPEFDIFDPRFPDLGIPCVVRGALTFSLTDYRQFIKLNRLIDFDPDRLAQQVRNALSRTAKGIIASVALEAGMPVLQIERKLDDISEQLLQRLRPVLGTDFGIYLKRVDIGAIELDKEAPNYQQLKLGTADQQTKTVVAQTSLSLVDLAESHRIQRKETELQVEGRHGPMHQLDLQADVLRTAAENMGGASQLGGSGLSAAGLLTGLTVGGAVGQQLGGQFTQLAAVPPLPPPAAPLYHVAYNGQQLGTFTVEQLRQQALSGQFTRQHYVWRPGLAAWELAGQSAEMAAVFAAVPPPLPQP